MTCYAFGIDGGEGPKYHFQSDQEAAVFAQYLANEWGVPVEYSSREFKRTVQPRLPLARYAALAGGRYCRECGEHEEGSVARQEGCDDHDEAEDSRFVDHPHQIANRGPNGETK